MGLGLTWLLLLRLFSGVEAEVHGRVAKGQRDHRLVGSHRLLRSVSDMPTSASLIVVLKLLIRSFVEKTSSAAVPHT